MGWREDRENFNQARCAICDGTGHVSLTKTIGKRTYMYGGFCCTCKKGLEKQEQTTIGQELGSYVNWLNKGFQMIDHIPNVETKEEVPF